MALDQNCVFDVHPTNGSDANGGGFSMDRAANTFFTDLAATVATGSSPVVTSASYNFVAGDVGHYVYVATGTNWRKGLYKIASVAANAATLVASSQNGGPVGVATVASPSGGTWSINRCRKDAAFITFDGSTIKAATAGVSPTIVVTGIAVTGTEVGNMLQISGGTNFTTGVYAVRSASPGVSGVGTLTLDRNCATGVGISMAGKLGGAFQTIPQAAGVMLSSNRIYVKAESGITITAAIDISVVATSEPTNALPWTRLSGYYLEWGDIYQSAPGVWTNNANRPVITVNAASIKGINAGSFWFIENLVIDSNSKNGDGGILVLDECVVSNVWTKNAVNSNGAFRYGARCVIMDCEISNSDSNTTYALGCASTGSSLIIRCNVHDNVCLAIKLGGFDVITYCLVANNSGNGIQSSTGDYNVIRSNTVYDNGGVGILINNIFGEHQEIKNNIIVNNAGVGLEVATSAGWRAEKYNDGNFYFNNTGGNRLNGDDVGTVVAINAAAPYTNSLDVVLTADPFTNAPGGDFTLNQTAGGGAAVRQAGTPGTIPGITQLGYMDGGALQAVVTASGGGNKFF